MNDSPLKDYDRKIRVAQTYDEIIQNRSGFFLSELAKQAQGRSHKLKTDEQIVIGAINVLTGPPDPDYKQALISLLQILTPHYYRTKFIATEHEASNYIVFRNIDYSKPAIMVHLWQSLCDHALGYQIEIEVANACVLIIFNIVKKEGSLKLWQENQKNTPENKS